MRLFDTHCHFDAKAPEEVAAILARAKAAGVERLVAVGGSREMNEGAVCAAQCAAQTEGSPVVLTAFGYDMDGVDLNGDGGIGDAALPADDGRDALCRVRGGIGDAALPLYIGRGASPMRPQDPHSIIRLSDYSIISPSAIGEIGLDYHYYGPETRPAQMRLFAAQLEEARRRGLPVIVHTREAADDTLALLREIPSRGVIHCFTGTPDEARAYLDLGFFVSFSGIVTFKSADNVRASARYVPGDRILIETDAPFLAPVPMRGKPNEPGFVRHTCEFLADLRGVSPEDFAEQTFANGLSAF